MHRCVPFIFSLAATTALFAMFACPCAGQTPPSAEIAATALEPEMLAPWDLADTQRKITDEGNKRSIAGAILLYPVNRVADLLDIFTLNLGFGLGLHANAHATRAVQAGAGGALSSRLGMVGRRFGLYNERRAEISALCFSLENYGTHRALGPIPEADTRMKRDRLYLDAREFTGVGASFHALILGFEAEAKPMEMVDFILGFAGIDFKRDDYPRAIRRPLYNRFDERRREGVLRVVFVTSRAVSSPDLRSESRKGISVYDARARSSFFMGEMGGLIGRGKDRRTQADFQKFMEEDNYDVLPILAARLERVFQEHVVAEVIPSSVLLPFEDRKIIKTIGGEQILRLPDYAGLCEALGAHAVVDVRLLEWSLYRDTVLQGLRVRLHVECKVIRHPQNQLLADMSVIAYDQAKRGNTLLDFAKDEGQLLKFESEQAVDRVVSILVDRLLEK